MPIFRFIAQFKEKRKFEELEQKQNEALIDTLTAAKAIDGQLRDVERQELLEVMDMLDWKGDQSMVAYIETSIDAAEGLQAQPQELQRYFDDISERLREDWLRQDAYYLATRMVLSNDEVAEAQRLLLKHLVKSFGISSQTQQAITERIKEEAD